jgi:hypothetical protein
MKTRAITIVLFVALSAVSFLPAVAQTQGPEELGLLNSQLQDLYRQGKYAEAIPVAEKILSTTENLYGLAHLETTVSLNNLALLYIVKERYVEAESLSRKALEILQNQLGVNQPYAASTLYNLAEIYENTGRSAEAEQLYRKSKEIRKKTKGMVIPAGSLEPLQVLGYPQKIPPKAEQVAAFWNTWIENQANGKRVEELKTGTGNIYSIVLDISRFSYFKDYAVTVGSSVDNAIIEAHKRGDTKIRFTIRPILHGKLLRFTDNHPTSLPLDVDITKLLKPKDNSSKEEIKLKQDKFLSGEIKLRDFSREEQAGEVTFKVEAKKPGDATISVSIWDSSGLIPLDHLTLFVRVTDKKAGGMKRSPASQTVPLKAGWGTLLDVSFDLSSTGPLVADTAFYIFEPSPEGNSIILFAARKDKEEKETSDNDPGVSEFAWETKSLLSQYIEDENQGILKKIKMARELAISASQKDSESSYQEAAEKLQQKIFTGFDDENNKKAADAQKLFRDLVQQKDGTPIVFVRMRNEKGAPVYLPLGILAAHSENPILDKRITLVQPLPRERYPASAVPLERWTFGVPEKLDNLTPQSDNFLKMLKTSADPRFHRNIKNLKCYFETMAPLASDTKPEGILLLAHQAGGNLWFTDDNNEIIVEDINRIFPPGSVAILSACSAASEKENNQAILKVLNNQGVDAMIISPFPVDANYGTMLAVHIVKSLEEAKAANEGLTMAELFTVATKKTAEHFKEIMGINFKDMDLEFLIAGDYRIRIIPR